MARNCQNLTTKPQRAHAEQGGFSGSPIFIPASRSSRASVQNPFIADDLNRRTRRKRRRWNDVSRRSEELSVVGCRLSVENGRAWRPVAPTCPAQGRGRVVGCPLSVIGGLVRQSSDAGSGAAADSVIWKLDIGHWMLEIQAAEFQHPTSNSQDPMIKGRGRIVTAKPILLLES